jgi:hypothetical protein
MTIRNVGTSASIRYTITQPANPPFKVSVLDSLSGTLSPQSSTVFRFQVDASGLADGTYSAAFTVSATLVGGGSVPGSPASSVIKVTLGAAQKVFLPVVFR